MILIFATSAVALDTETPIGFFTNFGSRLLKSELKLDLNRIQVYPTNQYTPAVHRLLQVTANLYDSTTNRSETGYPFLPSVFRPLFRRDDHGMVWISAYREVTSADLAAATAEPIDPEDPGTLGDIPAWGTPFDPNDANEPMVCGVPLIIGVKKGYPNFNKFGLENTITASRILSFHRTAVGQRVSQTNQSYGLSISSSYGIQAWNSYQAPFPRSLELIATGKVKLVLVNEFGIVINESGDLVSNRFSFDITTNFPAAGWPGFTNLLSRTSFVVPVIQSNVFLPFADYFQNGTAAGTGFRSPWLEDPANTFRVPKWDLNLNIKVRFALVDVVANRIVDYVNINASEPALDIAAALPGSAPNSPTSSGDPDPGIFWVNHRWGYPDGGPVPDDIAIPTYGIRNQILISSGVPHVSSSYWKAYGGTPVNMLPSIDAFVWELFGNGTNLNFSAPFCPTRTLHQYIRWEANDPLVHQNVSDLKDLLTSALNLQRDSNSRSPILTLGGYNPLSAHHRPWGGNPNQPVETSPPTQFNPAVKDPLIGRSDDWNFPSGEPLDFATLGRIHRGTPWQTIYLKSLEADSNTWALWSGNSDISSKPVADRDLVTLLDYWRAADPRFRLSINTPNPDAWLAALSGLAVLTNASPDVELTVSTNTPQAVLLANTLSQARMLQPLGYLSAVGDILSVPELSFASPWLNTNELYSQFATSDAALEKIPGQLLSLLRSDSVGTITPHQNELLVQFTGYDCSAYAIAVSPNLMDWTFISTNHPSEGVFVFTNTASADALFFRTVLCP
ncbi:MAG: hypothetical protein ACTHKU_16790 [Verrucomicrobiota bacterium]